MSHRLRAVTHPPRSSQPIEMPKLVDLLSDFMQLRSPVHLVLWCQCIEKLNSSLLRQTSRCTSRFIES